MKNTKKKNKNLGSLKELKDLKGKFNDLLVDYHVNVVNYLVESGYEVYVIYFNDLEKHLKFVDMFGSLYDAKFLAGGKLNEKAVEKVADEILVELFAENLEIDSISERGAYTIGDSLMYSNTEISTAFLKYHLLNNTLLLEPLYL